MFNLFKKKNKEVEESENKKIDDNVVKVRLIDCDYGRGNLYYDKETDLFYDWIITYDPVLPSASKLFGEANVFDKHLLIIGNEFYPTIDLYKCTYEPKDDIRYLKVLDETTIKEKFLQNVYKNSKILLEDGMLTIRDILLMEHKFYFHGWINREYKCWEVNEKYSLARIFNSLSNDIRDDYILNNLREIEYEMWT